MNIKHLLIAFLLVPSCTYTVGDNSWHWYSWKILFPSALIAGAAGITFMGYKFHSFNKKAGVHINNFFELKIALLEYGAKQISRFIPLKTDTCNKYISKLPIADYYNCAMTFGIHAGRDANPVIMYKNGFNASIKHKKKFKNDFRDS